MDKLISEKRMKSYRTYLLTEEKSNATIEKYLRDIDAFRVFVGEEKLCKEQVIAYKQHLIEAGYAVRSINSMLASLNSFFVFSKRHDLRVKALKLQRQVFCPEEKELTKAEYERLCTVAEKKSRRLFLILQTICGTGIRVSELPFITVEAVKKGEAVVSCKAKTRMVFIVKSLRKKLLHYITEEGISSGTVFVTRTGKPMSRINIWREIKADSFYPIIIKRPNCRKTTARFSQSRPSMERFLIPKSGKSLPKPKS